jgi:hypothetical protein
VKAFNYLAAGMLSLLLVGCDQKPKWSLVTTKDGLVYRINNETGDVSLVAGAQITRLDEFRGSKTDAAKKSYVKEWPAQTIKSLGGISLRLKTTWRDGKLQYILSALPISPQLQSARETSYSKARFDVQFYDADGFQLLSVPVDLLEMRRIVDAEGKPESLSDRGSTPCSAETYDVLANSTIGWAGFSEK